MDNVSGVLIRFKDQFLTFTNVPGIKIGVIDIIEILIISVLFYHILLWIKTTRAWNLFKGLIIILLFVLVAALFQMDTILWLAEKLFNVFPYNARYRCYRQQIFRYQTFPQIAKTIWPIYHLRYVHRYFLRYLDFYSW